MKQSLWKRSLLRQSLQIRSVHKQPSQTQVLLAAIVLMLLGACATSTRPITASEPAQILPLLKLPQAPATPIFGALQLPPMQQYHLANGIVITQLPSPRAPYIHVQLVIDAGRLVVGADADALTEMLRLTGNADTPATWQQQWRELGTSLSARSGAHRLIFSAEVLPHNADKLFDTLLQMWQAPNLQSAETLALAKRNLRAQQRQGDLLGGDALRLWRRLAFGPEHPYGMGAADRAALQAITTTSLQRAWHDARDERQQWLLAGEVSNQQRARWQQQLATQTAVAQRAAWRSATASPATPPAPLTIHLLDTEDAAQINVLLGYALPAGDTTQHWTCEAFAELLGMSGGRLYADLRERRGLTYDPASTCSPAPLATELLLTGSTRPEHAAAFVHGLYDHLRLLSDSMPSADEMQRLRGSLQGGSRMLLETARQRSAQYNVLEWLGGDWQTLVARDQFWQQLQPADLPAFAQRWLQTEPVIVIRGDAAQLEKQLRRVFPAATFARYDEVL